MNTAQGGILFLVGAVLTLALLAAVRRLPAAQRFQESNELTGMYVATIAAIYAVLLGFNVLAVWTRFDQAEARVEEEAATLAIVARLAHSLPPDTGGRAVIDACREYARSVVADEWTTMAKRKESDDTHRALDRLWDAVLQLKTAAPQDASIAGEAITRMTELSRLRQLRLLASRSGFPPLLWLLLVVGAAITTAISLLLRSPSSRQHALQAVCLWTVIAFSLLATGELAAPFAGGVRITSEAFHSAISTIGFDNDSTAGTQRRKDPPNKFKEN